MLQYWIFVQKFFAKLNHVRIKITIHRKILPNPTLITLNFHEVSGSAEDFVFKELKASSIGFNIGLQSDENVTDRSLHEISISTTLE